MFFILTQAYMNTMSYSFLFFPSQISCPLIIVIHSLYSPSTFHPSFPLVDFAKNPLDACLIRTSWKLCW